MNTTKRTEISSLGEFGLIERLTKELTTSNKETIKGAGDDAAILQFGSNEEVLVTTDLLMEGVHFDLTYFPLKHLGYKAVVANISDIYAMNGTPKQITVSIALSRKFCIEDIEELYSGIRLACEQYGVDIVGGGYREFGRVETTGVTRNLQLLPTVDLLHIAYVGNGERRCHIAQYRAVDATHLEYLASWAVILDEHYLDAAATLCSNLSCQVPREEHLLASRTLHLWHCATLETTLYEREVCLRLHTLEHNTLGTTLATHYSIAKGIWLDAGNILSRGDELSQRLVVGDGVALGLTM